MNDQNLDWIKIGTIDDLPEGRVTTVTARTTSLCLSHFNGKWAAMDNHCPHQGGPLGEGSIEEGTDGKCWIRCPWHGWDFDPLTGAPYRYRVLDAARYEICADFEQPEDATTYQINQGFDTATGCYQFFYEKE